MSRPARWVEIDLAALRDNVRALRRCLPPGTELMAVVKSDAYGHGMVPVARCLAAHGVTAFAVADVGEGVALRQAEIAGRIAVFLGAGNEEVDDVVRFDLEPVVFDRRQLPILSRAACRAGKQIGVHVKIDTGMGRIGLLPDEIAEFAVSLARTANVYPVGIMSHLATADDPDPEFSLLQRRRFIEAIRPLLVGRNEKSMLHLSHSAGLLRFPDMLFDMVRPGLALYGCRPADATWARAVALRPVMSFKTRILQIREIGAGVGVSYGHTYVTPAPSRLAVLPVGYNDGYLRALSNRAEVLVQGRRVRQRGRVCMNVTMVDVTALPGVSPGDEVTLMGRQGDEEISADTLAGWMGTISYEILCLVGGRNSRVYLSGSSGENEV
ncbi:MAG: alanine racemase [Thermodesulfobacteriota bacterium]